MSSSPCLADAYTLPVAADDFVEAVRAKGGEADANGNVTVYRQTVTTDGGGTAEAYTVNPNAEANGRAEKLSIPASELMVNAYTDSDVLNPVTAVRQSTDDSLGYIDKAAPEIFGRKNGENSLGYVDRLFDKDGRIGAPADASTANATQDYGRGAMVRRGKQNAYDDLAYLSDIFTPGGQGNIVNEPDMPYNQNSSVTGEAAADASVEGAGETVDNRPYLSPNSRPSFRKGVVENTWNNAKGPDGLVRDPNTGEIINWTPGQSRKGVWDMGHIPGQKYHDIYQKYLQGELTPKQFRDWYNNPNNYRPEIPRNNRGHLFE